MLTIDAIDHLVFNVRDVDVSAAWYGRVLGMVRQESRAPSGAMRVSVMFGRNKINLRPAATAPEEWFTADAPCIGSADLCLLTTATPQQVTEHFGRCGVAIVAGPVTKNGALGPICSVYVRDPDGNLVEVSSYPANPV